MTDITRAKLSLRGGSGSSGNANTNRRTEVAAAAGRTNDMSRVLGPVPEHLHLDDGASAGLEDLARRLMADARKRTTNRN